MNYAPFYRFFGWLIFTCIIVFILANWYEEIFSALGDGFLSLLDWISAEENVARRRRKRRQRKWKASLKRLREEEYKKDRNLQRDRKRASAEILDEAAYTLAIHQEIIEEMYGRAAPSAREVMRHVDKNND